MRFKLWIEISEGFMDSLKPTTFSQIDHFKNMNGQNKELYLRKDMLEKIEFFSRSFKSKNYVVDQSDIKNPYTKEIIDYAIKNKIISKINANQYQINIKYLTTQMKQVESDLYKVDKNSKNVGDFNDTLDRVSDKVLAPSSIPNFNTAVS